LHFRTQQHFNHILKHVFENRLIKIDTRYNNVKSSAKAFIVASPLIAMVSICLVSSPSDPVPVKVATSIGIVIMTGTLISKDSNKILIQLEQDRNDTTQKISRLLEFDLAYGEGNLH
jgi:hypothetical protein